VPCAVFFFTAWLSADESLVSTEQHGMALSPGLILKTQRLARDYCSVLRRKSVDENVVISAVFARDV
jgi:hypothetical protein